MLLIRSIKKREYVKISYYGYNFGLFPVLLAALVLSILMLSYLVHNHSWLYSWLNFPFYTSNITPFPFLKNYFPLNSILSKFSVCVCVCVRTLSFKFVSDIFKKINLFIYLFLAVLGLNCCARAFSSCGERGLLFVAVRGLLIVVASLIAEHGL